MLEVQQVRKIMKEISDKAPQAPSKAAVKVGGRVLFYVDKTFGGRVRFWLPDARKAGGMDLLKSDQIPFQRLRALDAQSLDELVVEVIER